MSTDEQQVEQGLTLILSDIIAVALRKGEQRLVPEHGELEVLGGGCRGGLAGHLGVFSVVGYGAEAQEVENKSVDDLVRQCVLLLEEDTDEDVEGTGPFGR